MNQHQLSIEAQSRPEILERILRVVRHRGFRICAMNMSQAHDGLQVSIAMTVTSLRPVDLLTTQLTKLMDVTSVRVTQQTTQQIHAEA
mgnify:FL=1